MTTDLDSIEARPRQYWNADGIPELVMGAVWIAWGGLTWLGEWMSRDQRIEPYTMIIPLLLVVTSFLANPAIKLLKAKLTFPRTGYVQWKKPEKRRKGLAAAVAFVVSVSIALMVTLMKTESLERLAAPATALVLALAFLVAWYRKTAQHMIWSALLCVGLAGILYAANLSLGLCFALLLGTLGIASSLFGLAQLRSYLRSNPVPRSEAA
jgi:hypothetical protein